MPIRYLAAIAAVAFAFGRAASAQAGDTTAAAIDAIHAFVAAEDDAFAKIQGTQTDASSDRYTYYRSKLKMPGAAACGVYTAFGTGSRFATCDYAAATEADAEHLWAHWTGVFKRAEPGWKNLKVTNGGHIADELLIDPKGVHAIYLYVAKNDAGGYRFTATFGTLKAIHGS